MSDQITDRKSGLLRKKNKHQWPEGRGKRTGRLCLLLSFLLPLAVMIACMAAFGVQPFGKYSLIIIDGLHQYMPFFSVLYDKLRQGGSFFYTWRAGLGTNFLSLMAYYLMSPLNLIIVFFRRADLNMAVSIILTLKIALSGLFMGIYLHEKSRRPTLFMVAAAAAYALNSYMIGYSWNVMWLDAVMVLPLIMLGLDRLIERNDAKLYCIALFYALACNYYIGYMICIFCVICFLTGHYDGLRTFFRRGISFAVYSLLAGGMAAVILIPAWMGIRQTAAGSGVSLPEHSWITSLPDLMNRMIDLAMPITHDNEFDGNANLYMGIFVLVLAILYLLNRNIRTGDKVRRLLVIAFFLVSFMEDPLNYIWHGFHNQYGIPNRFSFLLGFLLIVMAFELMENLEGLRLWQLPLAAAACGAFLLVVRQMGTDLLTEEEYLLVAGLMALYILLILVYAICRELKGSKAGLVKIAVPIVFSVIALGEISASAFIGFNEIGQIDVPKFFRFTEDMEEAIKNVDDGTFYRSEVVRALMLDEAIYYPMNTVGLFGSTAPAAMVNVMDKLGFATGANEYKYVGENALTNYLFGVRYQYYKDTDSISTEYIYKDSFGKINVYENPTESGIGCMVKEDIEEFFETGSVYPFTAMNSLAAHGFGVEDLFDRFDIPQPMTNSCSAEATGSPGEYRFHFEEKAGDNLVFNIPVSEGADCLYVYYDGTQVASAVVSLNGRDIVSGDLDGHMVCCGRVEEDSWLSVAMSLKGDEETGIVRLSVADMDTEAFEDGIASGQSFRVTDFTDNTIEGDITVDAEETGRSLLFLSIPYDQGWELKVDGKITNPEKVGKAFLGVRLSDGRHRISLRYESPGFRTGAVISLASLFLFLLISLIKALIRNRKRKRERQDRAIRRREQL